MLFHIIGQLCGAQEGEQNKAAREAFYVLVSDITWDSVANQSLDAPMYSKGESRVHQAGIVDETGPTQTIRGAQRVR